MHTAICTFDDRATAEQAVQRLVQAGFDRHDVHIQHRQSDGTLLTEDNATRWEGMEREVAVGHRVAETLGFFSSLFGQDAMGHTATYSRAMERGQCVVMVDAPDDAEGERAQNILLGMEPGDVKLVPRSGQPLRDIVSDGRSPGVQERFGSARSDAAREGEVARERAMASQGWGEQRTLELVDDDQPIASPRLQSDRDEKPR
ncbi:hypothetical protein WG902_04935 [Ramlibacter sp. PS3R-8]|uniref:hypothetical protein n=1 Tax=Ramlibacter sp. PS3R-8 TaxID=3133437 RepID=UPI0030B3B593